MAYGEDFELAAASWRSFLGIPGQYMCGCFKTVSNLGQNLFWKPFAQKGNPETFLSFYFGTRYKTDCQSCSQRSSFFWSALTVGDEIEILSV